MREYEQVDKQVINKVSNYDTPNFFFGNKTWTHNFAVVLRTDSQVFLL